MWALKSIFYFYITFSRLVSLLDAFETSKRSSATPVVYDYLHNFNQINWISFPKHRKPSLTPKRPQSNTGTIECFKGQNKTQNNID